MAVDEKRVQALAEDLLGTAQCLDDFITEAEFNDLEFLKSLDAQVMCCDTCGWWVDSDEMDDYGNCRECHE